MTFILQPGTITPIDIVSTLPGSKGTWEPRDIDRINLLATPIQLIFSDGSFNSFRVQYFSGSAETLGRNTEALFNSLYTNYPVVIEGSGSASGSSVQISGYYTSMLAFATGRDGTVQSLLTLTHSPTESASLPSPYLSGTATAWYIITTPGRVDSDGVTQGQLANTTLPQVKLPSTMSTINTSFEVTRYELNDSIRDTDNKVILAGEEVVEGYLNYEDAFPSSIGITVTIGESVYNLDKLISRLGKRIFVRLVRVL